MEFLFDFGNCWSTVPAAEVFTSGPPSWHCSSCLPHSLNPNRLSDMGALLFFTLSVRSTRRDSTKKPYFNKEVKRGECSKLGPIHSVATAGKKKSHEKKIVLPALVVAVT